MSDPVSHVTEEVIMDRSKYWTPELNKLLRKWKKQIGKREQGHLDMSRINNRKHYIFGGPATILTFLTSGGVLSTFKECDNSEDCEDEEWIRLAMGIIALVGGLLTTFQTFMNYQQESEKHKTAADEYGVLFRDIDSLLILPNATRGILLRHLNLSKINMEILQDVPQLFKRNMGPN